ncbi:MAG: DNA integrity scanning diadenylate cyclase DisA [Clostridioides sp.]|jgi:diadenylate cyclase|nr:DNA integrity scanning diadenylate cyclase DisA [Clostridioides sp.]
MIEALKIIAPGTSLRVALENILNANTGALIIISSDEKIMKLADGGFNINAPCTPTNLYELAKMDGAIILSSDLKNILKANVQMIPNSNIASNETGTRHRTAQRLAKQTGEIIIAVSQRRNIITLYVNEQKYVIKDVSKILAEANQSLQILEKYKKVFNENILKLNLLEFQDLVTIFDVVSAIQKVESVIRISRIIEEYIIELGDESELIKMQLEELFSGTFDCREKLIMDYAISENNAETYIENLKKMSDEDMMDLKKIAKLLGYTGSTDDLSLQVNSKGYRLLYKIERLPHSIIENLINYFGNFKNIFESSKEELCEVEGIGESRAEHIKKSLNKMQQFVIFDKNI